MKPDDIFTAPQVAKLCNTDLKTIHNWVRRGEIACFRTPGRHLRFRRSDIVAFLKKWNFPVPPGFEVPEKRALILDVDADNAQRLAEGLGGKWDVSVTEDYMDCLLQVGVVRPALVLMRWKATPDDERFIRHLTKERQGPLVMVYGVQGRDVTTLRRKGAWVVISSSAAVDVCRAIDTAQNVLKAEV